MSLDGIGSIGTQPAKRILLAQAKGGAEVDEAAIIAKAKQGKAAIKEFMAKYGVALADKPAQEDMVVNWLTNKYSGYPVLAANIIRVLGGKKLAAGPGDGQPSLMTINDSVKGKLGKDVLTPGQKIDDKVIKDAILLRWNERNSNEPAQSFDQLVK